jgi:hypothetical protein
MEKMIRFLEHHQLGPWLQGVNPGYHRIGVNQFVTAALYDNPATGWLGNASHIQSAYRWSHGYQ